MLRRALRQYEHKFPLAEKKGTPRMSVGSTVVGARSQETQTEMMSSMETGREV